ncbi:MAG: hypothetical protein NWQ13_01985 [Glaciimonas sp.]|nr:hypothetical protein [Glaciimonas sp.]
MNLIEKFEAKLKSSNAEPTVFHVEVYETQVEALEQSNIAALTNQHLGQRRYQLSDGRELKPLSDVKFIIVKTGEEIHLI